MKWSVDTKGFQFASFGATHAVNVYSHVMDKSVYYYTGIQTLAGVSLCYGRVRTDWQVILTSLQQ